MTVAEFFFGWGWFSPGYLILGLVLALLAIRIKNKDGE